MCIYGLNSHLKCSFVNMLEKKKKIFSLRSPSFLCRDPAPKNSWLRPCIAASILFPPTKNRIKCQLTPPLFAPRPSPREMRKKVPSSFHSSPHLDFEINSPPLCLQNFFHLKNVLVEILISDLVLIVN